MLLFEFEWFFNSFGALLIFALGIVEITAALLFFFYEVAEQRMVYAYALVGCLLFDSLIMQFPFTDTERGFAIANDHFSLNLMIGATLLTCAGFVDYDA